MGVSRPSFSQRCRHVTGHRFWTLHEGSALRSPVLLLARTCDRARRMSSRSARHPLVRRITGYSAGSVVAIVISEACFAAALGWLHTGTTLASAAGFVGGAVPNCILNRRWAWRDRRGRDRSTEIALYMGVALTSFLVSAVVTHWAEAGARHLTGDRGSQVALTTLAFLAVSGVFFVLKFVIYETLVFKRAVDAELDVVCLVEPGLVESSLVE